MSGDLAGGVAFPPVPSTVKLSRRSRPSPHAALPLLAYAAVVASVLMRSPYEPVAPLPESCGVGTGEVEVEPLSS